MAKGLRPRRTIKTAMQHELMMFGISQVGCPVSARACPTHPTHPCSPVPTRTHARRKTTSAWTARSRKSSTACRGTASRPTCSSSLRRKGPGPNPLPSAGTAACCEPHRRRLCAALPLPRHGTRREDPLPRGRHQGRRRVRLRPRRLRGALLPRTQRDGLGALRGRRR